MRDRIERREQVTCWQGTGHINHVLAPDQLAMVWLVGVARVVCVYGVEGGVVGSGVDGGARVAGVGVDDCGAVALLMLVLLRWVVVGIVLMMLVIMLL